jgi:hypothetical protein
MNDLLQTYNFLVGQMTSDPLLNLVSAVAWLDPIWFEDDDPDDFDDEHDIVGMALRVMRRAFPDIYIDAVERIRAGATYHEIDSLICAAVNEKGIPLDNLEFVGYGIPMDAFGVELECADFYAEHPDLVPVLALFGVHSEPNYYHVGVSEAACRAGRAIAISLEKHSDLCYQDLGYLMQWLWSLSGNTLIDFSHEMLCEMPPLSWNADDLDLAIVIIEEANEMMESVERGIKFLQSQPTVMVALERNIKRLYRAIKKNGDTQKEIKLRLRWPHVSNYTSESSPRFG